MDKYYCLPSGKVETGESCGAAAIREVKEEVGVEVVPDSVRFVHVMHRHEGAGRDWVDIYFEAGQYDGEVINNEPHKHAEVAWFDPKDLPDNIIPAAREAIQHIKKGSAYSEFGWL